jgi:hypothetical protein
MLARLGAESSHPRRCGGSRASRPRRPARGSTVGTRVRGRRCHLLLPRRGRPRRRGPPGHRSRRDPRRPAGRRRSGDRKRGRDRGRGAPDRRSRQPPRSRRDGLGRASPHSGLPPRRPAAGLAIRGRLAREPRRSGTRGPGRRSDHRRPSHRVAAGSGPRRRCGRPSRRGLLTRPTRPGRGRTFPGGPRAPHQQARPASPVLHHQAHPASPVPRQQPRLASPARRLDRHGNQTGRSCPARGLTRVNRDPTLHARPGPQRRGPARRRQGRRVLRLVRLRRGHGHRLVPRPQGRRGHGRPERHRSRGRYRKPRRRPGHRGSPGHRSCRNRRVRPRPRRAGRRFVRRDLRRAGPPGPLQGRRTVRATSPPARSRSSGQPLAGAGSSVPASSGTFRDHRIPEPDQRTAAKRDAGPGPRGGRRSAARRSAGRIGATRHVAARAGAGRRSGSREPVAEARAGRRSGSQEPATRRPARARAIRAVGRPRMVGCPGTGRRSRGRRSGRRSAANRFPRGHSPGSTTSPTIRPGGATDWCCRLRPRVSGMRRTTRSPARPSC